MCLSVEPSRYSMAMKAWPFSSSDVVDRADIGMIQRRCRLRLALKTAQSLGILGNVIGQKLERDKALEPSVFGLEHHAHAAAAEFFKNAVVRDGLISHSSW